jgi:hypothetical protein
METMRIQQYFSGHEMVQIEDVDAEIFTIGACALRRAPLLQQGQ